MRSNLFLLQEERLREYLNHTPNQDLTNPILKQPPKNKITQLTYIKKQTRSVRIIYSNMLPIRSVPIFSFLNCLSSRSHARSLSMYVLYGGARFQHILRMGSYLQLPIVPTTTPLQFDHLMGKNKGAPTKILNPTPMEGLI